MEQIIKSLASFCLLVCFYPRSYGRNVYSILMKFCTEVGDPKSKKLSLQLQFDCDTTTIRIRRIACLLPFDAIRREQKMNMSIFRRNLVV